MQGDWCQTSAPRLSGGTGPARRPCLLADARHRLVGANDDPGLSRSEILRASSDTSLRALVAALLVALLALPSGVQAQEPATEEASAEEPASEGEAPADPWPAPPRPPVYETWWFWTAIAAVVVGVTLAIVVGVTTEHPRSSRAGLVLAF